jgi:hypothetical protein
MDKDATRSYEFVEHREAGDEIEHFEDDVASPQDRQA